MGQVTFDIKSEFTENDKGSTISSTVSELESNISKEHEMSPKRKVGGPKVKYEKPGKDARLALIKKISHENMPIRRAASDLGINYSTAKSIYNLFKHESRLGNDLAKEEQNKEQEKLQSIVIPKDQTQLQGLFFESQFPQKKQFVSKEETTISKKDLSLVCYINK